LLVGGLLGDPGGDHLVRYLPLMVKTCIAENIKRFAPGEPLQNLVHLAES